VLASIRASQRFRLVRFRLDDNGQVHPCRGGACPGLAPPGVKPAHPPSSERYIAAWTILLRVRLGLDGAMLLGPRDKSVWSVFDTINVRVFDVAEIAPLEIQEAGVTQVGVGESSPG
jgi:hypothetical protein